MIECDYELQRNEGNKNVTYKPEKKLRKIHNLSYIKAPNSSGKSTFLNLISLSFFGQKDQSINPELRSKINDLISADHQKIRFNISITSKDGSIKIIAEKSSFDSQDYDLFEIRNGKKERLAPAAVNQKYKIIYDIPNNPTTRLKQLTDEVREEQNKYGNRIKSLRTWIMNILEEIKVSKDPKRINELKSMLKTLETEQSATSKNIKKITEEISLLESYFFLRFHKEYLEKDRSYASNLSLLEKNLKREERKNKKENQDYYFYYDNAKQKISNMQETYSEVTTNLNLILKDQRHLLDVWEKINWNQTLEDLKFNEHFESLIIRFKNILQEELDLLSKDASNQEALMYTQMIEVLENYSGSNINLSIINRSLNEFLNELKKVLIDKQDQLNYQKNIEKTQAQLAILNRERVIVENIFKELRKLKPFLSNEEINWQKQDRVEEQKSKLKEELTKISEKLQYYKAEILSRKLNDQDIIRKTKNYDKQYGYLNEEQLTEKRRTLNDNLSDEKASEREFDRKKRNLTEQINDLESKKEHKYKKYEDQLKALSEKIRLMDHKINVKFPEYLEHIKNEKEPNDKTTEQERYTEEIFLYLGRRLGRIDLHTGENVLIKKVNLFRGRLESSDGGLYRLRDMGTGQGQAAYLKGLLSTDDDRMIVAMFDEVGLMDEDTLMQIKLRLKELYDQNRLLLGLIVQKREKEIEVISL